MTNDPLTRLREELDEVDRRLLETVARRREIVRGIAAAKGQGGGHPLFDREREGAVYARAADVASGLDLPADLVRGLMNLLVEDSHHIQESAGAAARAEAVPSAVVRRFLIVGGQGRMGQLLSREFEARGHHVDVVDVDDGRDRGAAVADADITMISVPMAVAASVTAELAPYVRADALLCDINSLKEEVCAVMDRCPGEALGLHPMFGPTVRSLRRQKVVACPVRPGPLSTWLCGELERAGAEIVDTDPVTHDRMMAVVQVLVHFSTLVMGRALSHTGFSVEESLRFTSPIYRLELAFVGRLFAQSPDLYAEIEMSNPRAAEVRRAFLAAAGELDGVIDGGDRDAFRTLFAGVADYFESFAGEAMQLSDHIIETLATAVGPQGLNPQIHQNVPPYAKAAAPSVNAA